MNGLLLEVASLIEEPRIKSSQAPAVAVPRLSYSEACEIFSDQGLNLCSLRWQADSYPLHHQGTPPFHL